MTRVPDGAHGLIAILPGFLLAGLGLGAAFVSATTSALGDVEEAEAGIAGGVVNTSHELGAAIGVAFVSAIAGSAIGTGAAAGGFGHAYLGSAIVAGVVGVAATLLLPAGRLAPPHGQRFGH
jgi:hypothetical protein